MRNPNIFRLALRLLFTGMALGACTHTARPRPPADPIAHVRSAELRERGLDYAKQGDYSRAQQYLGAALQKGFEPTVIVPELVKICVSASRLRAALLYAEPYLESHPEDRGMQYVAGTLHLALGQYQSATYYLNGLQNEPGHDALFTLGVVAYHQGQHALAQQRLRRYVALQDTGRVGRYQVRAKRLLNQLSLLHKDVSP